MEVVVVAMVVLVEVLQKQRTREHELRNKHNRQKTTSTRQENIKQKHEPNKTKTVTEKRSYKKIDEKRQNT